MRWNAKKSHIKKDSDYEERDENERNEYDKKISEIQEGTPVVYIDESGVDKHLHRTKGRAKRGKKVKKKHPGKRFKRRNVVAGLCGKRVLAQCTYGWKTDSIWFAEWFELCLLPCLLVSSVIVMDNASFHNKTILETIAEAYGHKILWLPKYSPDKNPIENLWANMKKWLRSFSQNYASIQKAIYEYFHSRSLADSS